VIAAANSAVRRVPCLAVAFVAACGAGAPEHPLPLSGDDLCTVELRLGAAGTSRFVLDTGSQLSFVTSRAADRLGFACSESRRTEIVDSTGTRLTSQGSAVVPAFRLGEVSFPAVSVPEFVPDPRFPADGILGADMLSRAAWLFDGPAQRVFVTSFDSIEANIGRFGYRIVSRIPLRIVDGRPWIVVRIDERQDVELLLDTGSSSTRLPMHLVESLRLPDATAETEDARRREAEELRVALMAAGMRDVRVERRGGGEVGVGGEERPDRPFAVASLALGNRTWEHLVVHGSWGSEGLLGRDVLARFPWLLDWRAQSLLLLAAE